MSLEENYKANINVLALTVEDAKKTRDMVSENSFSGDRRILAPYIFSNLCARSSSILLLVSVDPSVDFSSLAVLSRSVLEMAAIFHYLCVEDCEFDEWELRYRLYAHHDVCTTLSLENLRVVVNDKTSEEEIVNHSNTIKYLIAERDKAKRKLKESKGFNALLDPKYKKILASGEIAFRKEIGEMIDLIYFNHGDPKSDIKSDPESKRRKWVMKYLSNFVHSYPFSMRTGFNFRTVESADDYNMVKIEALSVSKELIRIISSIVYNANQSMIELCSR